MLALTADGNIWSCGEGKEGQLGLGSQTTRVNQLTKITMWSSAKNRASTAAITAIESPNQGMTKKFQSSVNLRQSWSRIGAIHAPAPQPDDPFTSVTCGPITSGGITRNEHFSNSQNSTSKAKHKLFIFELRIESGKLFIWGYTYTKSFYTPQYIALPVGGKVISLAFGDQHIICILQSETPDGQIKHLAYSWGKSSAGALGHGVFYWFFTFPLLFFNDVNFIHA